MNDSTESVDAAPDVDSPDYANLPADVALPGLLEAHGGRLHSLALKFCGSAEDAEDLVQDVFLLAYRKWDQFKGESRPTTWLYTIAARACQRRKRRRSGEPRNLDSLDDLLPFDDGPVADLPAAEHDPYHAQVHREAREQIERALARLPRPYRMALILKDLVELPVADVARVLSLKEATVKTRVHRARLQLRRALSSTLPRKQAPPPLYSHRVCLDLLAAKQEALDREVEFPVGGSEVCERCASLFATLDLGRDACREIGRGELPAALRARLLAEMA